MISKALTVGGLNTTGGYEAWTRMDIPPVPPRVDDVQSARGGASITVGTGNSNGAFSIVDLSAAGENVDYVTNAAGVNGNIAYGASGTSVAAPLVAGAALAAKDYFLSIGESYFDNPGWLQAFMLGMGDRESASPTSANCTANDRLYCGSDRIHGLGRIRMRLLEDERPWGADIRNVTLTSSTPSVEYAPFANPIPSGAVLLKCVAQQDEDFSLTKADASHTELRVKLRNPVAGECQDWVNPYAEIYDAIRDDKHHVTFENSITGRCAYVELSKIAFSTAGYVDTKIFCYYAGTWDYADQ